MKNGVYNFNDDADKVLWLKGSLKEHALAMLDRWMEQDAKVMGRAKALEKRKSLIQQAKGERNEENNQTGSHHQR